MKPKTIVIAALVIAGLFVAIQFSMVYVNRTQLLHIIEGEALDARRDKQVGEEALLNEILRRAEVESSMPVLEPEDFTVTGLGERGVDLIVELDYMDEVDLVLWQIPMEMHLEVNAEAPDKL